MVAKLKGCLAATLLSIGFSLPQAARADFVEDFDGLLAQAKTDEARTLALNFLATNPADRQASFALGVTEFLSAIEVLGQGMYLYGLSDTDESNSYASIHHLPFLRLPMTPNPSPAQFTPEALREVLTNFQVALDKAETTIGRVPNGSVSLPLDITAISVDLDGNGFAQDYESLPILIFAISGLYLDAASLQTSAAPSSSDAETGQANTNDSFTVTFDESDVIWLRGYTHLISGIVDMILAHDWNEQVAQTFQNVFPQANLPNKTLNRQAQIGLDQLKGMQVDGACQYPENYDYAIPEEDQPEAKKQLDNYFACSRFEDSLRFSGVADVVAFIHLMHWQVIEPERLKSARRHFLTMIDLSRKNWLSIQAETDNNNEWIPSPSQTSLFPNMPVTDMQVAGWTEFLNQAEGVLNGTLLIPHWRFPGVQGLNIRRMFEEPQPLDPVLLLAGPSAVPFIEQGSKAGGSTMDTALRLLSGGMLGYFFWFN